MNCVFSSDDADGSEHNPMTTLDVRCKLLRITINSSSNIISINSNSNTRYIQYLQRIHDQGSHLMTAAQQQ